MVENRPATVSSTEKNERLVKERLILVVILGYRSSLVSWILHDIMHNYKWVKKKKKSSIIFIFQWMKEWCNFNICSKFIKASICSGIGEMKNFWHAVIGKESTSG